MATETEVSLNISTEKPAFTRGKLRRSVTCLLLICATMLLIRECTHFPQLLPMHDFIEYWAAGRLYLSGGHPYSPKAMLELEHTVGWQRDHAHMMLNPPWTLPLVSWLSLMPFRTAQLVWFFAALTLVIVSVDILWRHYGGQRDRRWVPLVIIGTFLPVMICVKLGQVTPLVMAGLVGFLSFIRRKRDFAAGLCLLAVGIKPQATYLVAIGAVFWIVASRRWRVAAGATLAYAIAIFAALTNPNSLDYLTGVANEAVFWPSAIGGVLRYIFGFRHFSLQFVPCIAGLAWMAWWLRRHPCRTWRWDEQMPVLVLVSLATTGYGWFHDGVIALVALIPVAVRFVKNEWLLPIIYAAANGLILAFLLLRIDEPWYFWTTFVWLGIYITAMRPIVAAGRVDADAVPMQAG